MSMEEKYSRTQMLVGKEGIEKLRAARVAVFGIGGVGSYALEALARAGVGTLDIIDSDAVAPSNINRQLIALDSTVGRLKVDVAKERIFDIDNNIKVNAYPLFFLPETANLFDFSEYDYVIDAVDSVKAKSELVRLCDEAGTPIISCMGMGNKLDPTRIEVADIFKTSVCPLARVMRAHLKAMGIKRLKVVYSKEPPITQIPADDVSKNESGKRSNMQNGANDTTLNTSPRKQTPGSVSFVPSVAGLIMAGEVIKDIIKA